MKQYSPGDARGLQLLAGLAFGLSLLLLFAMPIFRGSNRFAVLALVEMMAIASSAVMILWWLRQHSLSRNHGLRFWLAAGVIGSPFVIGLVQIGLSTTLVPDHTWLTMLAASPIVAMAMVAWVVNGSQLRMLVRSFLLVALLQVVVALFQLGGWNAWYFESFSQSGVIGTFANRNHLANLLVMVLPLVLWEMRQAEVATASRRMERGSRVSASRWFWMSGLLLVLAGLLATLSRTGIFLGALVVLLFLMTHNSVSKSRWLGFSPLGWALGTALILALFSGGWEWLARFESDKLLSDDALRAINRASTWEAVQTFWPMGAGLGTFEVVFPRFQDPSLGAYFINHAHNEYLQLLMEGGAWVLPPMAALVWLVFRRVRQLAKARARSRKGWLPDDGLAVACGLAFLAQALHAWVDYPWSIPATAMVGAFMLGVFLREPDGKGCDAAAP